MSPFPLLEEAYQVGRMTLRAYSHLYSPKKFTQPQLFACLVLKEFLRLDYRKLQAFLNDAPAIAAAIELNTIPHYTTFQKAAVRLLKSRRAERLLDVTVERAIKKRKMRRRVKLASLDGTGFETRHISAYYVKRRQKGQKHQFQTTTYTRYPMRRLPATARATWFWPSSSAADRDQMIPTSSLPSAKLPAARRSIPSSPIPASTARPLMFSLVMNMACAR